MARSSHDTRRLKTALFVTANVCKQQQKIAYHITFILLVDTTSDCYFRLLILIGSTHSRANQKAHQILPVLVWLGGFWVAAAHIYTARALTPGSISSDTTLLVVSIEMQPKPFCSAHSSGFRGSLDTICVVRDTQVSIESAYSVSGHEDSLTAAWMHILAFLLQKVLQQGVKNEWAHLRGV